MTHLIEKDALVAKINALLDDEFQCNSYDEAIGFQNALILVKKFLDTLEVKEVDLEKKKMEWIEQLCKYFKANYLYVSGHESFISDFRRYAKNLK